MKASELKKDVYWVGGIDWDIRNFHGYKTWRGTTYNSYLIVDEKITLIDTVKHYLADELLSRIKDVIDPARIDYVIANHVEMDHTGSLSRLLEKAKNATIVTNAKGAKGIERHYKKDWEYEIVGPDQTLRIGKRDLSFVPIPMVHWPDSMVTYDQHDKILFPNDAFGQHIAGPRRFDDEIGWSIVREEAAKYYANIVLPYSPQVKKALDAVGGLDIDMIAPSHGVIWRSYIKELLGEYEKWATSQADPTAVVVYDSMWGSTEKIAKKLLEGLEAVGIPTTLRNLKSCDISDVITDVLSAKLVAIGSPTLNNGLLPTVGEFLTYLKGLRPKEKIGFAFGSYGWGGQAVGEIEAVMKSLSWELPEEKKNINYIPDRDEFEEVQIIAGRLGEEVKNKCN